MLRLLGALALATTIVHQVTAHQIPVVSPEDENHWGLKHLIGMFLPTAPSCVKTPSFNSHPRLLTRMTGTNRRAPHQQLRPAVLLRPTRLRQLRHVGRGGDSTNLRS